MTRLRILALVLAVTIAGFTSCKKTPKTIGDNLQPPSSYIKVFTSDDCNIVAKTQRVDSLLTYTSPSLLIGFMYDDIFGISKMQTYFQMSPTVLGQVWGENAVVDSLVLQLCYNGYYGDTTTVQRFIVRELDESFNDSTDYYSNSSLAVKDNCLADYTFQPHPKTYSNIDDDSLSKAVLRIPLDASLGQSFIENEDKFETVEGFLEFFKGFNVSCEQPIPIGQGTRGGVYFFEINSSYTYLRLYYHNDTDTLKYDLNITTENYHFGNYYHEYDATAMPGNPGSIFDDTTGNYLYVQGTAGAMTWIKFPNIASWAKSLNTNVLVNEAKLILKGAPMTIYGLTNDTAKLVPPTQLIVAEKTGEGESSILDDQLVSAEYYGGKYDKTSGTVYFRLNQYVQDLIQKGPDAENLGLYLYVNAGSYTPNRWVFDGPNYQDPDSVKQIRLELIYSTIDTE